MADGRDTVTNEELALPEVDRFDPDTCHSSPPSYDVSRESRMPLDRANSSNSVSSLNRTGQSAHLPVRITRSASSTSFGQGKQRALSRTGSSNSFGTQGLEERRMTRTMSSASFFFSNEEFEGEVFFENLTGRVMLIEVSDRHVMSVDAVQKEKTTLLSN